MLYLGYYIIEDMVDFYSNQLIMEDNNLKWNKELNKILQKRSKQKDIFDMI